MFDKETFAGNLRAERSRRRLTREELADECGGPMFTIKGYEEANTAPGIENAVKLADYFGMTLDELVGRRREAVTR